MLHKPAPRPDRRLSVVVVATGAVLAVAAAGAVAVGAGFSPRSGAVANSAGQTPTAAPAALAGTPQSGAPQAGDPQAGGPQAGGARSGRSDLDRARARTREVPKDPTAWSALAMTALEAARVGSDPALYAEAGDAARRSLVAMPRDNDAALAAQAALADAEHDFTRAHALALQALAVNPASPVALAALTDALTELGRLDDAEAAARRLDATRPGVASFTRLSYQAELRGDLAEARRLMVSAAGTASSPAQVAFARAHEGQLALAAGDLGGAAEALRAGLVVAPDDLLLVHLRASLTAAGGNLDEATSAYATLVGRSPNAQFATEQAAVLMAAGDARGARTALDVARAGYALQQSAGVRPEGAQVLFEADHGDPMAAVRLGREVYRRSPTAGNADALGWALHRAGDDREALGYADLALAPTDAATPAGRPAGALYHRGVIRAALGDRADAIADLRAALDHRPRFSPADAPAAAALLDRLEGEA